MSEKIPITNSDEYGVYTNFKEVKELKQIAESNDFIHKDKLIQLLKKYKHLQLQPLVNELRELVK